MKYEEKTKSLFRQYTMKKIKMTVKNWGEKKSMYKIKMKKWNKRIKSVNLFQQYGNIWKMIGNIYMKYEKTIKIFISTIWNQKKSK